MRNNDFFLDFFPASLSIPDFECRLQLHRDPPLNNRKNADWTEWKRSRLSPTESPSSPKSSKRRPEGEEATTDSEPYEDEDRASKETEPSSSSPPPTEAFDLHKKKSPIDILARVFPRENRSILNVVLQRNGGDVLQAIDDLLSTKNRIRRRQSTRLHPKQPVPVLHHSPGYRVPGSQIALENQPLPCQAFPVPTISFRLPLLLPLRWGLCLFGGPIRQAREAEVFWQFPRIPDFSQESHQRSIRAIPTSLGQP
ncbi:DMA domain-containing protein [Trichonephila inaurata madagascariensis]|uniref:DMA domain-containing protein n=1 Tax=Trichonephila inaurata madagascariensis TaxID=2747483 RepID=A0A8X6WSY2_9ARAC|nr:DMA domain-containing protein [Trichonephila inaurata madagascariensis]